MAEGYEMIGIQRDAAATSGEQIDLYARDVDRLFHSNLRRASELRDAADELNRTNDATVRSLMVALGTRDLETEDHCRRIATLSVAIGRAVGVSTAELAVLERAALLHDVGKIGVPDAILRKPGPLNDEEWAEMRRHSQFGYAIIRDQPTLGQAAPAVLHHHERYDGSGYPDHLRTDEIPLDARIVAVADAFDAMTSDRPYRAAMTYELAGAEIARGRGHQFDPIVVDGFFSVVGEPFSTGQVALSLAA